MSTNDHDVRIAGLEEQLGSLEREVESLREQLRALAGLVSQRLEPEE